MDHYTELIGSHDQWTQVVVPDAILNLAAAGRAGLPVEETKMHPAEPGACLVCQDSERADQAPDLLAQPGTDGSPAVPTCEGPPVSIGTIWSRQTLGIEAKPAELMIAVAWLS